MRIPEQEKFEAFYADADLEEEKDSELCEYTGEDCFEDKMFCEECPVVECPFSRSD